MIDNEVNIMYLFEFPLKLYVNEAVTGIPSEFK
jgi:hypothetical protein